MHADIKGSLDNFEEAWKHFEHRDHKMGKAHVMKVLQYASEMGYKTTAELTDEEVDRVIADVPVPEPKVTVILHDTVGGGSRAYTGAEYVKEGGIYGWLFVDGFTVQFAYAIDNECHCEPLPKYRVTYTISAQ